MTGDDGEESSMTITATPRDETNLVKIRIISVKSRILYRVITGGSGWK